MCEEKVQEKLIRENKINIPIDSKKVNNPKVRHRKPRMKLITSMFVFLIILSSFVGYIIGFSCRESDLEPEHVYGHDFNQPKDGEPSHSWLHVFQKAAVCSDRPHCSRVGRDMLAIGGSAVDAAVAAMFCNGLLSPQSVGLGGGFFMTVYIKDEGKAYALNAREKAPAAASMDMFHGDKNKAFKGPLSAAVPAEVRGMWAAHSRWGKLPWKTVVSPSIELCKYGFPISPYLHDALNIASATYLKQDTHLRNTYFAPNGKIHPTGTIVRPSEALCNTLRVLAERGGDDLYNGSLSVDFLADLKKAGSIITAEDLRNYQPEFVEPLSVPLNNGDTLFSPPPPSSGVILTYILNILSGYHFSPDSIKTAEDQVLTYHRIIEAFKYAYAMRTKLGDSEFLELDDLVANLTSPEFGAATRGKIDDYQTSNDSMAYGADQYWPEDRGTAHMSIIAGNGDAVSVTSSINDYFGAILTTEKTGIILNNVMDDFSSPSIVNDWGLKPSPANFIAPGKRPQSSMSPTILVDGTGNAKLVIGASGGTKITTSVSLVTIRKLWFGQSIKEAVDATRIHHQIFPMEVAYQAGLNEDIVAGLRAKGHGMEPYQIRGSNVCALFKNQTAIYGNSDYRNAGDVAGID